MKRSESIKELTAALCKFHQEVGKIRKTSCNPFFNSKYATLSDILDVIMEPLTACGLTVVQFPTGENELESMVMHESGEFISSGYIMKPVKNDPQGIGSCITYQRRYALGAILCLNIDDDDDGNNASGLVQDKSITRQKTHAVRQANKAKQKKILTVGDLTAETTLRICEWLARKEEKARTEGLRFSVLSLIEETYQVGKNETEHIIKSYNEYKKEIK